MSIRVCCIVLGLLISTSAVASTSAVISGGPGPERMRCVADVNGPDPLSEMSRFAGRGFDWQYMMSMYKQNSTIACIAALGVYRASCQPLKDLSCTIYQEQLALNTGLQWASLKFTNAPKPSPNAKRLDPILTQLGTCTGAQFDRQYAAVMMELMRQSERAAQRGIQQVEDGQLLAQAHATYRVNSSESKQLESYRR